MFYTDFGTEYTMSLDGTPYKTFISGPLAPNMSVPIDRNGDGRTSRNYEVFLLGKPFNITGTTYVLESVNGKLNLSEAKESVPRLPMPPDLRLGKKALEFKATTMDGTEINFPKSFQGKIVMLDFWATWCGPCVAEVPNMKKAYEAHHENGFEILGVSFDQPNAEQVVQKFLSQRELTWPQIYEGKFWDTTIGQQHDVGAIPFVLLVDGDSGEILGTSKELRGAGLSDFIAEQLEKKNAGKKTP